MARRLASFCVLALVVACSDFPGGGPVILDSPPPEAERQPKIERSADSIEIERFFGRVEENLLARGLLRGDGGGPDVPFTDAMLARNFLTLAFSEEFSGVGGRLVDKSVESTLHRWEGRVRIEPVVGPSVDAAQASQDIAEISAFAARLAGITDHPIQTVMRGGNFRVVVLNDQELRNSGPLLKEFMPELAPRDIAFVQNISPDTYCLVFASDPAQDGRYERAVAVIRAELPSALRTSCIQEEIAQGLGLSNDSPLARPSIFNDDDEFGRLTSHDEFLLQMLYDSRLKPGMNKDDAAPIVREISAALLARAS